MAKAIKHSLIPKQTKLSEKEKATVLEEYEITFTELPLMKTSDPSLAEMGIEEGDVIKIERESPTAGKTLFYRGVING